MDTFTDWKEAHTAAVTLARQCLMDVGIEACKEYGRKVLRVKLLPKPENRYGWELRCEVVRPSDPL